MQLRAEGEEGVVGEENIFCLEAAALTSFFAFCRATMTIQKSVPCTSCKEQWKVSTVLEPERLFPLGEQPVASQTMRS